MRTIIAGSRGITCYQTILKAIRKAVEVAQIHPTCIISGGALGVEKKKKKFAKEFKFQQCD